jgi:hypothetical protein
MVEAGDVEGIAGLTAGVSDAPEPPIRTKPFGLIETPAAFAAADSAAAIARVISGFARFMSEAVGLEVVGSEVVESEAIGAAGG